MAAHEYRDAYFEAPDLLETALPAFFEHLVAEVRGQLARARRARRRCRRRWARARCSGSATR